MKVQAKARTNQYATPELTERCLGYVFSKAARGHDENYLCIVDYTKRGGRPRLNPELERHGFTHGWMMAVDGESNQDPGAGLYAQAREQRHCHQDASPTCAFDAQVEDPRV